MTNNVIALRFIQSDHDRTVSASFAVIAGSRNIGEVLLRRDAGWLARNRTGSTVGPFQTRTVAAESLLEWAGLIE